MHTPGISILMQIGERGGKFIPFENVVMNFLETAFNFLHYSFYVARCRAHFLFNKINPFLSLRWLTFLERRFSKSRIDIQSEIDEAFTDQHFGIAAGSAGAWLLGTIFNFFFAVLLLADISISPIHVVACAIASFVLAHYFVFRRDKYLCYFKRFEELTSAKRRGYHIVSLVFVLITIGLWIMGLIY